VLAGLRRKHILSLIPHMLHILMLWGILKRYCETIATVLLKQV